ncbi:hypothetical protein NLX83_13880 [Allokutzneria sp. A3M-2-11 16]|uniref:hypothetical protein n=1 Tax=Allokutzneria sp. A3M-2-11 16 TaxID=2962043 RepID=UPI0020B72A7F|nr:hypothetical protein [Allokutzneria sp. A3M-2-11 16]MCP3800349.1 hypothetical protein [Allokutzneria sp. A3M-2-11 16]
MSTTMPAETGARLKIAKLATEVLAPWVWVLTMPLAIAWPATGYQLGPALWWGLLVGFTGAVIPMAVIIFGAKRGRWDGHHVTNREGRLIPILACIGSVALGLVVIVLGDGPREMTALTVSMIVSLVVCLAITQGAKIKVSFHAAVPAGVVITLVGTYGPWALLVAPVAALVAWSRIEINNNVPGKGHTIREAVLGTAVGAIVGGGGYWGLLMLLT